MSPRFIQIPVSGRDRRHYVRELERVRQLQANLVRQTNAAYQKAHLLACEEWNARQFIGGPAEPSPLIIYAIEAGCPLLEVQCRACLHTEKVDLALVIWPREYSVHTMTKALRCSRCWNDGQRRTRPNLVALHARPERG